MSSCRRTFSLTIAPPSASLLLYVSPQSERLMVVVPSNPALSYPKGSVTCPM